MKTLLSCLALFLILPFSTIGSQGRDSNMQGNTIGLCIHQVDSKFLRTVFRLGTFDEMNPRTYAMVPSSYLYDITISLKLMDSIVVFSGEIGMRCALPNGVTGDIVLNTEHRTMTSGEAIPFTFTVEVVEKGELCLTLSGASQAGKTMIPLSAGKDCATSKVVLE